MEAQLHQTREAWLNYVAQCRLHLNVGASSHSSRRKKPYSGRIRCACGNCGYTVHTTRKWLNLAGAPLCPKHGQMEVEKMPSPTTV